jgi:DNA polymerase-3 subunit chi
MTRVDFHFNVDDPLDYGCRLARKIFRAGERAVFWCADAQMLSEWDRQLWTFSPQDFIPHVAADDALASQTPIVLSSSGIERPDRGLLVSLGFGAGFGSSAARDSGAMAAAQQPSPPQQGVDDTDATPALPPFFSRYERLIELVSTAATERAAARTRWRFYRDRGYVIHTHEVGKIQPNKS